MLFRVNTGNAIYVSSLQHLIPFGDKGGHFMMYGTLALLLNFSFEFKHFFNTPMNQLGSICALLFSTAEEFSQLMFATRTFDYYDMVANVLGILAFTIVSLLIGKQLSKYNTHLVTE